MFSNNNSISIRQLKLLLILDIFGMGITTLPRKVVEIGGQDGWFLIIIGLLFSLVSLYFINQVAMFFPQDNFFEYTSKLIGKPLAFLITVGFIFKIIINTGLELRIFSEILKEIMLFNTPSWLICLSMLLLGSYMASKGIEARGRMAEILIWIVFIPLAFVFLICLFDVDFSNLKPVLSSENLSLSTLLSGGMYSLFYFSGIQYIFFIYPYINTTSNTNYIKKATFSAVIFIGLIISLICLLTIARFGKQDINHQMWSVLEIMDAINLPGSFIERQEAFIITFWIISIFMIVNAGVFFSSLLIKDVFKKHSHTTYILLCIPLIFFIALIPYNIASVYKLINLFYFSFELFYLIFMPVILYLICKARGLIKLD
ncbi:MAG: endospore germination permease [bacterium]